jgi:hypothetical protein
VYFAPYRLHTTPEHFGHLLDGKVVPHSFPLPCPMWEMIAVDM